MNGPTVLLLLAPAALAYAVTFLAAERAIWRRRERYWRDWVAAVQKEMEYREGLRKL